MADILNFLVESAFRNAEAAGAFDDLPGAGKPLPPVDQQDDATLGRILREARAEPPAVTFLKRISESQKRLADLKDPAERTAEMRRLADLQTRLAIEKEAFRRHG
ncbi:DnaJ family domain-containing protein [Tropicimonas sp. IMCC6043]|uniref:DnaJ family domain-containing protein n=1 Tax=Tropicimonas sp. IMCC6043 TaxID=2510645 RepID=UPI0013EC41A8|nr:DnaJ family domain-containing protein [Tropicimonas sp. IMCC6043]